MPRASNRFFDRVERFAVDVILERRWGFRAAAFRFFLFLLSGLYRLGVRFRLWWYESRLGSVHALGCLVVSVGNLTVGGTGKTPVVELFARELTRRGRKVAILSRGYKSQPAPFPQELLDKFRPLEHRHPPRVVSDGRSLLLDSDLAGDEPFMLASNLKDVLVLVDKDRVKSGLHAIRKYGAGHAAVGRRPAIPAPERTDRHRAGRLRGALRQPAPAAARPVARGTRATAPRPTSSLLPSATGRDLTGLRAELRRYNGHADFVECAHKPIHLEEISTHEIKPLEFLKELRVGAISGIARPESFEEALRKLGADIIFARRYADHHRFSEGEVLRMLERSKTRGARALITTEKDIVRFPRVTKRLLPVYFLRVEIEIIRGHDVFARCVDQLCRHQEAPEPAPALA